MGIFTGGALEEPLVRRADLILAFGLDSVELIPRRWSYTAPVLSLVRGPSSDPRLRAIGGGAYFTPALEVVGDLGTILEDLAPRIMRRDVKADWDVAEVDRIRRERAAALEVPVPGLAPHRVAQIARELTAAGSIATVDAGPDLIALGRAFGIRALAATDEPTLHGALIAAQTAPGPTLIDARIDPSGYRKMLEIVRGAPK